MPKRGAVIVPYAAQSALALGGQGVYAILDAAVLPNPLDRVVDNYAEQYGNWLLRK